MRPFALTALLAIVVLNCFLAFSGQALAQDMGRMVAHDGVTLSTLSRAAFALQPWFYVLAAATFVAAALGFNRKVAERGLVYLVVSILVLDIVGLLVSLWGFGYVHFLL
jgi:hypothetical protein